MRCGRHYVVVYNIMPLVSLHFFNALLLTSNFVEAMGNRTHRLELAPEMHVVTCGQPCAVVKAYRFWVIVCFIISYLLSVCFIISHVALDIRKQVENCSVTNPKHVTVSLVLSSADEEVNKFISLFRGMRVHLSIQNPLVSCGQWHGSQVKTSLHKMYLNTTISSGARFHTSLRASLTARWSHMCWEVKRYTNSSSNN